MLCPDDGENQQKPASPSSMNSTKLSQVVESTNIIFIFPRLLALLP